MEVERGSWRINTTLLTLHPDPLAAKMRQGAFAFLANTVSRRSSAVRARPFGSKSDAPKFDDVMTKAYTAISENHKHEKGPWTIMTQHAVSHAKGLASPSILDLATGPGEPAKSIAMALPDATVIATDVSQDMIEAAAKNTEDLDNIKCVLADAQDLSEFDTNSIDIVTCCYGYMFPTDKAAALSETHRVLKAGGILIATTWDKLDMMKINRDVMLHVLGEEPPPPPLNPMSLSEDGLFRKMLEEAGFYDVNQTTSTYPFNYGSDREFQFTIGTMLLRSKVIELAETDEFAWQKAKDAFWTNIEKYSHIEDGGNMVVPENTFRLTIAKKK